MGFSQTETSVTAQLPAATVWLYILYSLKKSEVPKITGITKGCSAFPSLSGLTPLSSRVGTRPRGSRKQEEFFKLFVQFCGRAHNPPTAFKITIKAKWLLCLPLCPPQESTSNIMATATWWQRHAAPIKVQNCPSAPAGARLMTVTTLRASFPTMQSVKAWGSAGDDRWPLTPHLMK